MFNGNYVKLDATLRQVAKYPFMEGITKRQVANELVALLGLVGAVLPLKRRYKDIEIVSHKGVLPTDIMFIQGVNNKGDSCDNQGIVMNYASDIYNSVLHSDAAKAACAGETVTSENATAIVSGDTKTVGNFGEILAPAWTTTDIPLEVVQNSYSINGSSIDTSFSSGFVEIAYDSINLDDNGFPLIPDDEPFKQALKYFILKNRVEPEYFRGTVTRQVYNEIDKQYSFYVASAGNSFNMPSPDQMQSIINGLVRILPRDDYADGWKDFNKKNYSR